MHEKIIIPNSELEIMASRASGPGGQNVNKVNSKITLKWNVKNSLQLSSEVKLRFQNRFQAKINQEGELLIISHESRSQKQNIDSAIKKLHYMIESVRLPPKPRVKTKPTFISQVKRLSSKKKESEKKKLRSKKY